MADRSQDKQKAERLRAALRANLRRRKAKPQDDKPEPAADNQPD